MGVQCVIGDGCEGSGVGEAVQAEGTQYCFIITVMISGEREGFIRRVNSFN